MSETVQCHVLDTNLYNNIIYIYIFYILLIVHILFSTIFATSISTHFRIPTMASMIYIKLGNPLQTSIMSSSKLPKRQEVNGLKQQRHLENDGTNRVFIKTALSTELWSLGILKARHKFAHGVDSLSTPKAENKQKMAIATTVSSDDMLNFSSHHPSNVKGKIGQGFYAWTWFKRSATKCATQGLKFCHLKTIHLDAVSKRWAKGIPHTATHQWWPQMFELWQPMLQRWDKWYELDYLPPRFHYIFRVQLQYANTLVVLINIHVHKLSSYIIPYIASDNSFVHNLSNALWSSLSRSAMPSAICLHTLQASQCRLRFPGTWQGRYYTDTDLYRVIRCHILDHSCSMFLDLERSRDPTHHSEKQHLELLQDCFQSLYIKFFEKSVNSICSWIVLCVVL